MNKILLALFVGLFSMGISILWADQQGLPTQRRIISPAFDRVATAPVKIAFFDADSTLRVAPSGKVSANSASDVAILPMVAEKLAKLASDGYLLAIVSNQAGIEKGYVSFKDSEAALVLCIAKLARQGALIHYFDFAEAENENRKPEVTMAKRLGETIERELGRTVDWANSFMVGDSGWKKGKDQEPDGKPGEDFSNSDRLFAENLNKAFGGVPFFHPRDYFGWTAHGIRNFPDYKSLQDFLTKHPELAPKD